jgi:hypothetical protein
MVYSKLSNMCAVIKKVNSLASMGGNARVLEMK